MPKKTTSASASASEVEILEPTHLVITPVRHDGKYYGPERKIGLSEEDGARLESLGVVSRLYIDPVPTAASEAPAPTGDSTGAAPTA